MHLTFVYTPWQLPCCQNITRLMNNFRCFHCIRIDQSNHVVSWIIPGLLRAISVEALGRRLSVCTHSPGANSTKAMADMLVFQTREGYKPMLRVTKYITKVTELWNRIKNSHIGHSHKRLRQRLHSFACLQF
jgi:hypothetical protein